MHRNFLAISLFFLLSFFTFSNSKLSFKVNSQNGIIQYTNLDTGNKDFVSFSNNFSSFDIPSGSYKIKVHSSNYIDYETVITLKNEHKSYNIILQEKRETFFISALEDSISKIFFSEDTVNDDYLSDLKILFYKGDVLVKSLDLQTSIAKINLDFGLYNILVYQEEQLLFTSKKFKIDESTPSFLNILLKTNSVEVNGSVVIDDLSLGGANVIFTDVDNNRHEFITDIAGNFKGSLPNKKYKVNIDKYGYELAEGYDILYDFTDKNSINDIKLEVSEIMSVIKGKVVDELGNPIQGAFISIGYNNQDFTTMTDSYGRFEKEVTAGTIFIRSKKEGYTHKGLVKRLEKASTLSNLEVVMRRNLFFIKGLISSGTSPIKKQRIDIVDSDGTRVASTLSGNNGYFEFFDIPSSDNLFLKASIQGFKPYTSSVFKLDKNIENHIILLENQNKDALLSFEQGDNTPLGESNITIEEEPYTTDSNGMIYYYTDRDSLAISHSDEKRLVELGVEDDIYEIKITDKETN